MEKTPKPSAERERIKKHGDEVTISSDDSFPASDPPSFNPGITGPIDDKPLEKEKKKNKDK